MRLPAQTPDQLSALLRGHRQAVGLTQKQAAAMVGLLPKTISALESHPERSSVGSLFRLLSSLGLEMVLQPKAGQPASPSGLEW